VRPGEALALRWIDINFYKGRIYVQRALQQQSSKWSLEEPKTSRSSRQIPIPPTLMKDLVEHRRNQIEEITRSEPGTYNENHLVFVNSIGNPLNHKKLYYNYFKPLLKKLGCLTSVYTTLGILVQPFYCRQTSIP
jgi:integrase